MVFWDSLESYGFFGWKSSSIFGFPELPKAEGQVNNSSLLIGVLLNEDGWKNINPKCLPELMPQKKAEMVKNVTKDEKYEKYGGLFQPPVNLS